MEHDSFDDSCAREDPRDVDADADADEERDMRRSSDTHTHTRTHARTHTHARTRIRDHSERKKRVFTDERVAKDIDKTKTHFYLIIGEKEKRHLKMHFQFPIIIKVRANALLLCREETKRGYAQSRRSSALFFFFVFFFFSRIASKKSSSTTLFY